MWEFLKSNARKERERIEEDVKAGIELEKKLEEDRVEALYLIESKRLNDKLDSEIDKYIKKETKRVKNENEICPKCKSRKVVDKISQLKGEINGSSSNNSSYGLFGGSSSGSGYIHGSMDTLEVNKCNDCTNEWKKITYNYFSTPSWENKLRFLRLTIKNLDEKPDAKEPYYLKGVIDFWSGTKLDLFPLFIQRQYLGYMSYEDDYYRKEILELIKEKDDILINKLGFVK